MLSIWLIVSVARTRWVFQVKKKYNFGMTYKTKPSNHIETFKIKLRIKLKLSLNSMH